MSQTVNDQSSNTMGSMTQSYSNNSNGNGGRRVTYPFVPTIDTSSSLMMNGLTSPENSGSSPLMGSPFPVQGGLVGVNSVGTMSGVQGGMVRSSPLVGYMDAMTLQHHQQHQGHPSQLSPSSSPYTQPMMPNTHLYTPPQQHLTQSQMGTPSWLSTDGSDNGQPGAGKQYSFVPLSGVNTKKRPRRRFDEIERLYVCNWADCEKAYGTLNHLNAHVNMQKHGPKRHPSEFKELRKAWRRQKKAEEEAAKQAAAVFHQEQQQQQQNQHAHQTQFQLCDPILANMQHPHALTMHMAHHQHQHQPHQLPHPHAHPNQHPHHHSHQGGQSHHHHHHPMGF
ncbi:hypothetical protein EDD11_010115 [Mortierella claussenii]|nr:hypothetical protein EDD11_010115 [Mortierella claussenii]